MEDDSVRLELTVTKEGVSNLERVKELISHQNLNASFSEVINFLANHFLDQKDPLRKVQKVKSDCIKTANAAPVPASRQKSIPTKIRIEVFKIDQCCQWQETITNKDSTRTKQKCGSKFQLQVDHIKPRWQGGTNEMQNLQLLCSAHNKLKYKLECVGKTKA